MTQSSYCVKLPIYQHAMTPDQINKIKAAAQMLRESAKQFRVTGNPGHAKNCEFHANEIEGIARKHEVQNEFDNLMIAENKNFIRIGKMG